jgi:hypothetical protein
MPSGRRLVLSRAFGMYTRLTATGRQVRIVQCTRTASSALAAEVNATSPSIPAVLRPTSGRWSASTSPIRPPVFNVGFDMARMKLVGGDSGRVEQEAFVLR